MAHTQCVFRELPLFTWHPLAALGIIHRTVTNRSSNLTDVYLGGRNRIDEAGEIDLEALRKVLMHIGVRCLCDIGRCFESQCMLSRKQDFVRS